MNIVCVICSDLLAPSDDVFHTSCGHIFHYVCLIQWLERSKTCPQCRERTTERMIQRIYFNFSNNDSIVEDTTSLQNKIDNLSFQIKLKDKNLNELTETNEKLKNQAAGLRCETRKVESELKDKNSAIHALKDQIKFYKQQCSDADNYRKDNEHLKKDLEHLKNVQNLIDKSLDSEVKDIITMTTDSSKLITYIAVLRREMKFMSNKSKEIRDRYMKLQNQYTRVSTENKLLTEECTKRKELEKQLMICENEKICLQTQLLSMQAKSDCAINETFTEDPESLKMNDKRKTVKESKEVVSEHGSKLDSLKLKNNDSCIIIDPDSTYEGSPQGAKSQGFFSMRDGIKRQRSSNNLKVTSILAKKSKFIEPSKITANGSMSFDGFGGHAKYDKFPNPIPGSHIKKIKKI